MKGNRVGLVQGSGKERVSSGISIVTPFTLGITLDSTGMCEYTLHLECDLTIFLKACFYEY